MDRIPSGILKVPYYRLSKNKGVIREKELAHARQFRNDRNIDPNNSVCHLDLNPILLLKIACFSFYHILRVNY